MYTGPQSFTWSSDVARTAWGPGTEVVGGTANLLRF